MPVPTLLTVKQFSERHPAFSEHSLRFLIFRSKASGPSGWASLESNGLEEAGAIVRVGRRVLIDEARFFDWIEAQQGARMSPAGSIQRAG